MSKSKKITVIRSIKGKSQEVYDGLLRKPASCGINSWPEEDRPREKLLKKGAQNLSNSELLAILLRTGTSGSSAIDLARKILKKFSTFRNMAHTDARDWKDFKGLGTAKVAHIQAALEIGTG